LSCAEQITAVKSRCANAIWGCWGRRGLLPRWLTRLCRARGHKHSNAPIIYLIYYRLTVLYNVRRVVRYISTPSL
jgi:hypothetical protein